MSWCARTHLDSSEWVYEGSVTRHSKEVDTLRVGCRLKRLKLQDALSDSVDQSALERARRDLLSVVEIRGAIVKQRLFPRTCWPRPDSKLPSGSGHHSKSSEVFGPKVIRGARSALFSR
jgi:hypothetical protein